MTVRGAGFTDTLMGVDGLTSKMLLPPKVAVMECEPAESREVVKVAVNGALPVRLAEPRVSEPSVKVTVPVGLESTPFGLTVAVKVTLSPYVEGLGEAATVTRACALAAAFSHAPRP